MKYFIGKVKDTNVKGINKRDVIYYIEFGVFDRGGCYGKYWIY